MLPSVERFLSEPQSLGVITFAQPLPRDRLLCSPRSSSSIPSRMFSAGSARNVSLLHYVLSLPARW